MKEEWEYYKILGVNKGATEEEIKKAYRQKAKMYHPDMHQGDKYFEEKFKELQEAYEVVCSIARFQESDSYYDDDVYSDSESDDEYNWSSDAGIEFDNNSVFTDTQKKEYADIGNSERPQMTIRSKIIIFILAVIRIILYPIAMYYVVSLCREWGIKTVIFLLTPFLPMNLIYVFSLRYINEYSCDLDFYWTIFTLISRLISIVLCAIGWSEANIIERIIAALLYNGIPVFFDFMFFVSTR